MSQYFENDKNIKSEKRLIHFSFDGNNYSIYSDNGVFSKDKLDYGTRILLESIDIKGLLGRVLDLGCGIGVVGLILGKNNENIVIDMVDVNDKAVKLAKENISMYNIGANVFKSNIYDDVSEKYDYIITNPPIRAGKDTVRKFLLGSFNYLNRNGSLYFVMRKDHGVKSMLKELEEVFVTEIVKKNNGFYVIKCNKK